MWRSRISEGRVNIPTAKTLFRGLFSRLFGSAIVVAGFYLLWVGFVEGNALKAVPGAALIPGGLYLMVTNRRAEIRCEDNTLPELETDPEPRP